MKKDFDQVLKAISDIAKAAKSSTSDKDKLASELKKQLETAKRGPKGGFNLPTRDHRSYGAVMSKRYKPDSLEYRMQQWNDDVLLASAALRDTPVAIMKRVPEFREFLERELEVAGSELEKALSTGVAGSGSDWIPEVFSSEMQDLIRLERALPGTFRSFAMNANPMRLPRLIADMSTFVISESTTETDFQNISTSSFQTDNLLLEAVKLGVASRVSDEFTEDSIVPAIPEIRRNIVLSVSGAIEDAEINGSTAGSHPDSDVAAGDPGTAWDGLRAVCMGAAMSDLSGTVDLASVTVDNMLAMIRLQGRFGSKPSESLWLTSPQGLVTLMGLQDAAGNQVLITADKFGAQNLLTQGAVGQMFGRDVIVSDFVKTNLNGSGVVGATPSIFDRTQVILYNKAAFIYGDRRALRVESERVIGTGQTLFVATVRGIFRRIKPGQTASDRPVVIGRNLATA